VVTQSVTAYERVMKLSKIRTDKICKLYHDIVVQIATEALAEKKFEPLGDTGIELGSRLSKRFTTTDMLARVDDGVNIGQIVLVWMNHRWVVGCAPGTYEKTEQFGKKGLGRI
jgi:hypothetical protein